MPYTVTLNRQPRSKSEHLFLSLIHIAITDSESVPMGIFGGGCNSADIIVRNAMQDYDRRNLKVVGFCNTTQLHSAFNHTTGATEVFYTGEPIPFIEVIFQHNKP